MARILSIEDDPDLQHLLGLTLHREGYDVHYAFTGQEGYEKVLSLNPDLVILDMMLPILNGVEVLKLIKAHKKAMGIPVIVVTAYAQDAGFVESAVKQLGVVEYLRKPVRLEELLSLIKRILSAQSQRTPISFKLRKGAIRVDPKFRTVWINDRLAATLPAKRFEVLLALVQGKSEIARDELTRRVWGLDGNENSLEKTIQRLREDLGPSEKWRIRTTASGYEIIG